MKERPILFSGEMVKGILEGRKTQTRRVLKRPHPKANIVFIDRHVDGDDSWRTWINRKGKVGGQFDYNAQVWDCPYGVVGDCLWVREKFCVGLPVVGEFGITPDRSPFVLMNPPANVKVSYAAGWNGPDQPPWRPSIHMPRWASRITLELTDVRVQRVQEITEDDARAEGVPRLILSAKATKVERTDEGVRVEGKIIEQTYRGPFEDLWDKLNAKRGYSWESNPWVWALTFARVQS